VGDAECFLVEQARLFDARVLSGIARRLIDTLCPDGRLADEREQQRRRRLTCLPNGDGMYRINGDLDGETAALALTVLHSLAAPKPTDAGGPDERSSGQRLHDAFRSVLKLALRAGELPTSGGVPATVLITMTAEQFEAGTGLVTSSFDQLLRVDQALRLAGEASIAWVVHNSKGGILNYGATRRVASDKQTLALIARDQGCAFPGCTDPPEWTEMSFPGGDGHLGIGDADSWRGALGCRSTTRLSSERRSWRCFGRVIGPMSISPRSTT
jgi:hypothetical protein